LIRTSYPGAQLYCVQATNPVPANSPGIACLTIVCIVDQYADAVSIASTNAYTFGPVRSLGLLVGGGLVPWPVAMDITEADTALKQAGYSGTYNEVMLRQPLYPGMDEPCYVFSMTGGPDICVGVNDGKISAGY
jgi:hypothetical protein